LHRGKNVFNPTLVAELHACLTAVRKFPACFS
jgi:hypothetical protein